MTRVTSIGALVAVALLLGASQALTSASVKGYFETCGERAVAEVPGPGSYELILTVKRARCDAGQKVAQKYFKKAGAIVPEIGNVEFVQHYRCVQKNWYSPYEPSFECRNKARDRVVKGLFPPENVRADAKPSGGRVFGIEDCNNPEPKPDRIVLACADAGVYINALDWKSWGGSQSRATGVIHAKTCVPICPGSPVEDFPVKVRYEKPRNRTCGGGDKLIRMYTRLHLSFPDGEPERIGPYRDTKVICF